VTDVPARSGAGSAAGSGVRDPQSFDHLAGRYDRFAVLVGAELRAWLSFHLPAPPADPAVRAGRVLDAGCGTGVHTRLLAERYGDVLAVDLSAPMVVHARRHRPRGNVRYEVRDLHEVDFRGDGPFDVVLCAYTLHHLPDLLAGLRHLRSLTRPGGTVLLVDVVDDRGTVRRSWFRTEAWRGFRDDLLHHRRPVAEAVELLRLNLDPDWLDHQTTDKLWPPAVWDAVAREVFPGATITGLYRARALCWRAPVPLTGATAPTGSSGPPP
jgi:SAM-dependent methyltransferase